MEAVEAFERAGMVEAAEDRAEDGCGRRRRAYWRGLGDAIKPLRWCGLAVIARAHKCCVERTDEVTESAKPARGSR